MAKPCTYIPKFPTYNYLIQVWPWSFAAGHHVRTMPDILGQVQVQDQSAHEGEHCTAYLRYPPEYHDRLRDLWDLGSAPGEAPYDAVSFLLPGGRRVWYRVREVQGMGIGFVNEHLVGTLAKLTHLDATEVQPPYDPPEPFDPEDPPTSLRLSLIATPTAVQANGVAQATITATAIWSDGTPATGLVLTFTATGSAQNSSNVATTGGDGKCSITATNIVVEETDWRVSGAVSNKVNWTALPPAVNYWIVVGPVADGICAGCAASGDTTYRSKGPAVDGFLRSDPYPKTCNNDPYVEARWKAAEDGSSVLATMYMPDGSERWNEAEYAPFMPAGPFPQTLNRVGGESFCDYPESVEIWDADPGA